VQQRRAERLGVESHAGADLGDTNRVGDELIAGSAQLIGMPIAGEVEGTGHSGAVDRRDRDRGPAAIGSGLALRSRVELLDNREEIGEKLALL
jgi:hypothetical protein